ncbi:MAG: formylmethanofuran dehydrogenase subunit A, partial [Planctomycetota bacterium]
KKNARGSWRDLDEAIVGFDVTPRQIIDRLTQAANDIELPHPVHIHCNNLGIPGNYSTTLETMNLLAGRKAHLTHIQFHSYGGGGTDESKMSSQVQSLVEVVNQNPDLSVDVGQVMFGRTTSMTADGPLGYYLQTIGGEKWFSADVELESGCGISPIDYRNTNKIHALQWAIGLEWYLSVNDPWQVVMSSDHPNGGSFLAYPKIIRLLMDSAFRKEELSAINPDWLANSFLPDIDREYSLNEIAIITRAGPAKLLGLKNKGHLGIGADADITVYSPNRNYETMFAWPHLVVKGGDLVVEDGEFRQTSNGKLISVHANYDQGYDAKIQEWFHDKYSIPMHVIGP